ncbi:MAG: phosphoribosylformylglycinamidine cyclo-ligase [Acidobacteriota bacterium]
MTGDSDRPRLTYSDAGVDRDAAAGAKRRIGELVRSTFNDHVLGDIGGFGGGFRLPVGDSSAVLVASADGVGTKLKVAVMANSHEGVGYDIVAHCADDILTQGAVPLFFLDYLALGKMEGSVVEEVLSGVAQACRDVGAALIGGETAEMPDIYQPGEYDLAGFIVGQAIGGHVLDGSAIRPGDRLLGLSSSGLHTNGYSLVRKIVFELQELGVDDLIEEWGCTVGEELLRPHRAYVASLREPIARGEVNGLAHITGGGLYENVPRMLPEGCGAVIDKEAWEVPPVFRSLQEWGGIPQEEMWHTFNMGVGMVAAVASDRAPALLEELIEAGEQAFLIGGVIEGESVRLEAGFEVAG